MTQKTEPWQIPTKFLTECIANSFFVDSLHTWFAHLSQAIHLQLAFLVTTNLPNMVLR